ncbi:MAG: DEAD/DEAH box helicase, partial [Proteobacteria bacterium]
MSDQYFPPSKSTGPRAKKPGVPPSLKLDTEVQYIKGVGPKLGEILRKKGVETLADLLEWYPRAYEDRRAARTIASLQPDELVSLKARVLRVSSFNMGASRRKIYDVVVTDGTGKIHCKYFRAPYKGYFERFKPNQEVRVIGKVSAYRGQIEFNHPDIQDIKPDASTSLGAGAAADAAIAESAEADKMIPIYPESEGLTNRQLRRLMEISIDAVRVQLAEGKPVAADSKSGAFEKIPEWIRKKYDLVGRFDAIKNIHLPPEDAGAEFTEQSSPYHRRIIFEEFFWLELYLASKKSGLARESAPAFKPLTNLIEKLYASLPFKFTGAQHRALGEIVKDLAKPHPMHRLVQGDVGSGKTLVALAASLVAKENGFQSAIMVPTEILAEQHYQNAVKYLEPLGLTVGLLTGSMKTAERNQTNEMLRNGAIDFVVGTHALIQDTVEFKNLGLVIIDEQHRFGVQQRNQLKKKGVSPHFLVMTATPIPRTLAMTVYG